jgi:hypothetical protein
VEHTGDEFAASGVSATVSSRTGRWSTSDEAAPKRPPAAVLRFPELTQRRWWRVVCWLYSQGLLTDEEKRIAAFLNQGRQTINSRTGWIEAVDWGTGELDGGMGLAARYAHVHALCEDTFWTDLKRLHRKGLTERVVSPCKGRKARYALCLRARLLQDLPRGVVVPPDLADAVNLHLAPSPEDLPDPTAGSGPGPGTMMRRDPANATVVFAGDPVVVPLTPAQAKELASRPRWEGAPAPVPEKAVSPGLSTDPAPLGACSPTRPETLPLYARTSSPFGLQTHVEPVITKRDTPWKSKKAGASAAAGKREPEPTAAELLAADAALGRAWHCWKAKRGPGQAILSKRVFDADGDWILAPAWRDLRRPIVFARRRVSAAYVHEELTRSIESARDLVPFVSARLWRIVDIYPPVRDATGAPRRGGRITQPGTSVGQMAAAWAEGTERGRAMLAEHAVPAADAPAAAAADNPLDPAYGQTRYGLWEMERAVAAAQAALAGSVPSTSARLGPAAPVAERSTAEIDRNYRAARKRRDQERGKASLENRLAAYLNETPGGAS